MRAVLRRRAMVEDDVLALHREMVKRLSVDAAKWWRGDVSLPEPDFGVDLEAQVNLSHGLIGGRGYVAYVYRSPDYIRDTAEFDDRLIIEFDDSCLPGVLEGFLDAFVRVFRPYRAALEFDEDLVLDDWDAAVERSHVTGRDEDGRHGVWRIAPRCYFDGEFCKEVFGIGPQEIAAKLQRGGIEACELAGGVLLDEPVQLVDRAELIDFDRRVRMLLGIRRSGD